VQLRRPHQTQRRDDGEERCRIEEEAGRNTDAGDEQPGYGWPDDARGVDDDRVEPDGVGEIVRPDHLVHEALPSGHVQGGGHAGESGEHPDKPHRHHVGGGEDTEGERQGRGRGLCEQHEPALVDAVGQRAGPGPDHEDGSELQANGDTEIDAAAGELQHEPVLRH
jgi:hypothetical protein